MGFGFSGPLDISIDVALSDRCLCELASSEERAAALIYKFFQQNSKLYVEYSYVFKLDAVASSSPLISAVALTARNSSKTLKCPKCNWHYKYHETLEIHMKEKHAENEVRCIYCVQGRAHPRLARGESYSCGYKPYRCELCKYSTTTKGNLSIHMQSDKHLHAVQEMPAILSEFMRSIYLHEFFRRHKGEVATVAHAAPNWTPRIRFSA
uniref:C2H2-type domain-containing protein n=1 Tax=Parascaris equorum TaxID=6256 RepID=A0A914RQT9_PAREQ